MRQVGSVVLRVGVALGAVVLGFFLLQIIPYGREHTNPPVVGEPPWISEETRVLFGRACADCHSNQTVWRSYSELAPMSWIVQSAVDRGRAELNVSTWPAGRGDARASIESIQRGSMPPNAYEWLNPEARLTAGEKQALIEGLRATYGGQGATHR